MKGGKKFIIARLELAGVHCAIVTSLQEVLMTSDRIRKVTIQSELSLSKKLKKHIDLTLFFLITNQVLLFVKILKEIKENLSNLYIASLPFAVEGPWRINEVKGNRV